MTSASKPFGMAVPRGSGVSGIVEVLQTMMPGMSDKAGDCHRFKAQGQIIVEHLIGRPLVKQFGGMRS